MQQSHSPKGAIVATGAIMLVVGGLAGFGITKAADMNMNSNSSVATTTMKSSVDGVTVGGATMVRDKDIVDNAVNANNVTTLVAAVKAAGLVDTLKSAGPFTVFAPTNAAFDALPAGTVDTLLKPENKSQLVDILTYHVVSGTYTTAALKVMAAKGQTLTSVQGEMLTPVMVDNQLEIQDAKGNKVVIETPDVISSNGVTHVIKSVLMPIK
jgi:uncharacterized surface protein with fasciclin (FAS1) repeats